MGSPLEVFYPLIRGRKPGTRARGEELAGTVLPIEEKRIWSLNLSREGNGGE